MALLFQDPPKVNYKITITGESEIWHINVPFTPTLKHVSIMVKQTGFLHVFLISNSIFSSQSQVAKIRC